MSIPIDVQFFISRVINTCSIVKSSRLDKTIKALINNFRNKENLLIVEYLNKIRIIYYLKRLEYSNSSKAREYKGTSVYL